MKTDVSLILFRTFGSSVYTPATSVISERFGVSTTAATLPLTLYVLGLAFGPVISAPISETFGRRIVYLTLFPVSLLFTLGAGLAQNYGTLMVCRFLAGSLGAGCLAVGAGTNSDLFPPLIRATVASVFLLAPFFGPALGPVAGAFLVEYESWRWTQWIILMIGLVVVIMGFFQKETYKKIILLQRAQRLNLPPPPNPMAKMTPLQRIKFVLTITISTPIKMLLTEPIVSFLAIYTAFNFGVLFIFFACFPLVFSSPYPEIQVYHFALGDSGLVFLGIGVGVALATILFVFQDRLVYQKRARLEIAKGKDARGLLLPPEQRVLPAIIGSFLLPTSLFWFAWTAKSSIHWIVPILATVLFGAGNILVFFTAVMYQLDSYGPMMGASAMAANGILRYMAGGVFPLFARQMYRAMGVGWATSLLGFVTVALMPLPWILFKYGPVIRGKSKYASFSAHM
jgi:multidrug resistance protein